MAAGHAGSAPELARSSARAKAHGPVLRSAGAAASVRPSAAAVREAPRWVAAGPSARQAAALRPAEPVARDVALGLPLAARDAAEGPPQAEQAEVSGAAAEPRQAAEVEAWAGAAAPQPEEAALRREARDAAAAGRLPAEAPDVAAVQRRAAPWVLPSGLLFALVFPRGRLRPGPARPAP